MAAPYVKRYPGGFLDLPNQTTPVDSAFLNAVETALLHLLGEAPLADEVGVWSAAGGGALVYQKITNAQIDAGAAIDKTKLGPLNIVDADIAATAGIAKSKLAALGIVDADIAGGAAIALSKLASMPQLVSQPVTALPGSPVDGQQALLVDSLTAPTYIWLLQYDSGISDANKWMFLGGTPLAASAQSSKLTSGYVVLIQHTAPRAGLYNIIGSAATKTGGAILSSIKYTANTVTIRASDTNFGVLQFAHVNDSVNLAAAQAVTLEFQSNDTDSTYISGSLALLPVRIA